MTLFLCSCSQWDLRFVKYTLHTQNTQSTCTFMDIYIYDLVLVLDSDEWTSYVRMIWTNVQTVHYISIERRAATITTKITPKFSIEHYTMNLMHMTSSLYHITYKTEYRTMRVSIVNFILLLLIFISFIKWKTKSMYITINWSKLKSYARMYESD